MANEPKFTMPACHRRFFKGHRWWCRACDRETESQFREVCEVWWRVPREKSGAGEYETGTEAAR